MDANDHENQLVELAEWRNEHYFGKYRGTVDSVSEGDDLGMIAVRVPEVYGSQHIVENVRPCSPFAGSKHGFVAIPEPGDGVWVEFEAGKLSRPIWSGFWWASGAMPEPKGKLVRSFITTKGHKLLLDDDAGEVTLQHSAGAELVMSDSEIVIRIGGDSGSSITLTASDLTLKVGGSPTSPNIKIQAAEIAVSASTVGTVKLTAGGVDIANGAMKLGA
jgi:uncharacterized protein involved in type VI secretion and phage assembly